jgi:TIR domain
VSDIFISYSKSDRAKAQVLAKALEGEGWSVWWDPKMRPGQSFDEVIDRALEAARSVIVLWSKKATLSDYVKSEAWEGKQRGILIPALIEDDVRIPLDFRRLHASRLADWQGEGKGHLERCYSSCHT